MKKEIYVVCVSYGGKGVPCPLYAESSEAEAKADVDRHSAENSNDTYSYYVLDLYL